MWLHGSFPILSQRRGGIDHHYWRSTAFSLSHYVTYSSKIYSWIYPVALLLGLLVEYLLHAMQKVILYSKMGYLEMSTEECHAVNFLGKLH